MLDYLRNNKRFWMPPIVIFAAILIYVAWKSGQTPSNPFEYRDR